MADKVRLDTWVTVLWRLGGPADAFAKRACAMDKRIGFIVKHGSNEWTMTELCERYEISRKTGYCVAEDAIRRWGRRDWRSGRPC